MQFYKPKRELRSIWTENLCNRVENLKKTCISAFWHSRQYSTRSKGDRVRMNICVFDIGFFFFGLYLLLLFSQAFFCLASCFCMMAQHGCCAQISRLTQLGYIYLGSALSSAVYYKMNIAKLTHHRHRVLIGSWENVRSEDCLPIKFRNMICEKDVIAVSFSFLQNHCFGGKTREIEIVMKPG